MGKEEEKDAVTILMEMMSTVPRDTELINEHRKHILAVGMGIVRAYQIGEADVIEGLCMGLFMYGVTIGQQIGRENLGKAWDTAVDD